MIQNEDDINQIKDMAQVIKKSGRKLYNGIEKFLVYKDLVIKESTNQNLMDGTINVCYETVFQQIEKMPDDLNAKERVKINVIPDLIFLSDLYFGIIITELLENALKFSDQNEKVLLNGYREKNTYQITIADLGRGMTEHEINSITAFKKYGENQFAENGLGVGLSIVKKIIDLCGGRFTIKSEINKYTTCELTLPLNLIFHFNMAYTPQ